MPLPWISAGCLSSLLTKTQDMRTTYSRKFKLIYALVLALTFYVMLNPSFNHSQDYNRQVMAATGGQR